MTQVLDYSAGFPGALAIARAGYMGAVRYIGFPDRRKCTTQGEYEDFSRNGLGMALVYEDTAGDWRGGRLRGVSAGQRARDHANAIGFPTWRPIYAAIDEDVVTEAEFLVMLDYLRSFAVAQGGPGLTGVYGEGDVIDRARTAGVAAWFWQTKAWSRGRVTAAHLLQLIGTVNVGGVGCDINDISAPDWGQHNAKVDDVGWSDTLKDWDKPNTEAAASTWLIAGRKDAGAAAAATGRMEAVLAQVLAAVTGGGIDPQQVLDRVDTAVREATEKAVTDSILPAVARIEAALAADNTEEAKAIVAELGAQLRPAA